MLKVKRSKMVNKEFIVAGIKNLMKTNYDVDTDLINVEDKVDSTITMSENWSNIKEEVIFLCPKKQKVCW